VLVSVVSLCSSQLFFKNKFESRVTCGDQKSVFGLENVKSRFQVVFALSTKLLGINI